MFIIKCLEIYELIGTHSIQQWEMFLNFNNIVVNVSVSPVIVAIKQH